MSDYIPVEIITRILKLVTNVKDLVRCRRVSLEWQSIIDSEEFIKWHLARSKASVSNLGLLIETFHNGSFFCLKDTANFCKQPLLELHLYSSSSSSKLIGSCDGLVCYWIFSPPQLVVLNPSTAVRIIVNSFNDARFVEIYCIRESCKRKIVDVSAEWPSSVLSKYSEGGIGVYVCGALYWVDSEGQLMVALDLESETLRFDEFRFCNNEDEDEIRGFRVGVVDSCLSVCVFHEHSSQVDVWIMGINCCWKETYKIQFEFESSMVPVGGRGRILFMLDYGVRFLWYDTLSNKVEDDVDHDVLVVPMGPAIQVECRQAFYCLESLVKLFPAAARRRIN
ncbi:hypothetical protein LINGRAHAP2_LOCUS14757 [Linum grandiflorum]